MPRRAPKRHRATTEWRPVRGRERPLRYLCRMSETRHVGDTPDVRHPSGRSSVSQRSPVLITRAPAPDRCQLQDRTCSVKAAFARTSARPFYRCDCLAVTDGLDGFRRPRTIRQREQGRHSPRLIPVTVVCRRPRDSCFSHQPTGVGAATAEAPAGAKAGGASGPGGLPAATTGIHDWSLQIICGG